MGEPSALSDSMCKFVSAPLDYGTEGGETISLFLRRFPALQSPRGSILLLAGGPGESGASYYADIDFFRDLFADFELIVPDHRGTGYSTKLCEPEETEASKGGFDLVDEEWGTCFGQLYSTLERVLSVEGEPVSEIRGRASVRRRSTRAIREGPPKLAECHLIVGRSQSRGRRVSRPVGFDGAAWRRNWGAYIDIYQCPSYLNRFEFTPIKSVYTHLIT